MQEGKVALGEHLRQRHAGADRDTRRRWRGFASARGPEARTIVESATSPSLSARITQRAAAEIARARGRSESAAAASARASAKVFTAHRHRDPTSRLMRASLKMLADRLEAGLIDLLADHLGQPLLLARAAW